MEYSINLYLKNKKKFETINNLIKEAYTIKSETHTIEDDITSMRDKLIRDFAGKSIKTGLVVDGRSWNLVIGKLGFGKKSTYSRKADYDISNKEILEFLKNNKPAFNKVKSMIKKPDKKEVLAVCVRNLEDSKSSHEFKMNVNRKIIDPDSMKETLITRIMAKFDSGMNFEMIAYDKNGGSIRIDADDSIQNNMVKEQLYLPIWKLLIKMKRYALKQKRKSNRAYAKLKKELEPFWVLDKLVEATE